MRLAFEGSARSGGTQHNGQQSVGVSDDLEMFTPEVHSDGSGSGRTTPDGVVRRPHVRNDAEGMGVGVDELVRGRNYFLWWHGGRDLCVTDAVTTRFATLFFPFKPTLNHRHDRPSLGAGIDDQAILTVVGHDYDRRQTN